MIRIPKKLNHNFNKLISKNTGINNLEKIKIEQIVFLSVYSTTICFCSYLLSVLEPCYHKELNLHALKLNDHEVGNLVIILRIYLT